MKELNLQSAFPALLAGVSALCGGACEAQAAPKKDDARPNIIFIITDQQTASAMGCAGNPHVKTPAMDALAADGMMLTRAYCPFPLSNPCRASLMTGYMPWQTGVKDNGQAMEQAYFDRGIGHVMTGAGYECLYAGKWHIPQIDVPDNAGFTKISGMNDPELVDNSLPWLEKRYEKPVFLVASFLNPHEICEYARDETLPYGPLEPFHTEDTPNLPANFMPSTYDAEAVRIHHRATPKIHSTDHYTQDDWRRYIYAYYRLVERVDREIGRLVGALKANGLYDDSLIIFVSDHGDGVSAHQWNQKWALFEEVVNVPLIVKLPGGRGPRGVRNDRALSNVGLDIFVTICDFAGVEPDNSYRGRSLRAVAEGRSETLHEEVFIETLLEGIGTRGWSIVENKYKYVLYNWFRNREQLYDLEADPGEMVNLAVDRRYADEVARLRRKMYEWGRHIDDWRLVKTLGPLVGVTNTP